MGSIKQAKHRCTSERNSITTIPTLDQLVDVNLRGAWNHEAHSFTPWLAEHLDLLSTEIGIPLALEGCEMPVETFSADILARIELANWLHQRADAYEAALTEIIEEQ